MPRTFYKCPRCGSQLLMLRRMVWQAFDGNTHELGPIGDVDWDDSLEAYCRECDPNAAHIFELRESGADATRAAQRASLFAPDGDDEPEEVDDGPVPEEATYFSEEDKALANAVELLREAADACDAADPQARDAILSLAHDLAENVVTKS
jgi:hypothetical protein